MITHIVMFKIKEDAPEDAAHQMRARLMELPEAIDVVRKWEVGINIGASSKPFDMVVYSTFDSMEDVATFRDHPKHVEVKAYLAPFLETSGTVDYQS